MIFIDICSAEQYPQRRIHGAIETNTYPVKTDAEKERLTKPVSKLKTSATHIIIVCPGGGGRAGNTENDDKSNRVDGKRMLRREQGMEKFLYETEKTK